MADVNSINDEEQLLVMLSKSENFEERKKIRARMKEVRDKQMQEWEARRQAESAGKEDEIKKRHREADLAKQKKLEAFKQQAKEQASANKVDTAEQMRRERQKQAEIDKQQKLAAFNQKAKEHTESAHLDIAEKHLKERHAAADVNKQKQLEMYDRLAGKEGITQTTASTTSVSQDGKTTTTTRKTETVTRVGGAGARPGAGRGGPGGAKNMFKAMDAKTNPGGAGRGGGGGLMRSPSAIKTMLLEWCKAMTREYVDTIEITNFSTSWNDGMAFCALIHHFYPEAFDFSSLDPKQRRKNFDLAFDTAEKYADIAPLLDTEDMVRMKKPDWKCVFTYVQSFYRKLQNHERNRAMPT